MLAGPEALGDLVDANHILARRGLLDGFGHISARDGDRFLIARNIARLQSEALQLGPLVPLNAHEARRASEANDSQIERAWELWKSER